MSGVLNNGWCGCRNSACTSAQCVLCKQNPAKRCSGNFAGKYWVGDRLLAKCDAELTVEIMDSNKRRVAPSPGLRIQVKIPHTLLHMCTGCSGDRP